MATYKVVSGDTLSRIGSKTKIAWQNIAKWNNIRAPYIIHVGQVLQLQAPVVTPTPTPVTPTPTPVTPTPVTPAPSGSVFSTTAPMKDRVWGVFAQDANSQDGTPWELQSLRNTETKVGYKFPVVSGFTGGDGYPLDNMKTIASEGRTSLISWEAEWNFSSIISGSYDSKLKTQAAQLKALGGPVILRPWGEMNGNWSPWSVGVSKSLVTSTAQWIDAWKHVVTVFRNAGATNVKFMWCPNNDDVGKYKMEQYWPGSDYVDLLGFDGYNWGGSEWQTHKEVFSGAYNRLAALDSKMPIWVSEFSSPEGSGTQKATWITNLMNETGFPRLQALCWFSINKEKNWLIDSSASSLQAFKNGIAG